MLKREKRALVAVAEALLLFFFFITLEPRVE